MKYIKKNEIMYNKEVKEIIAEVLSLDDIEEVKDDSNIVNDLGAESIDFIDMCFQLEQRMQLPKVNVVDIFPVIYIQKDIFTDDGNIKEEILKDLNTNYPHIDEDVLALVRDKKDNSKLFTVLVIIKYIESKKR